MICTECAWGADHPAAQAALPDFGHGACQGCDCAHGVSRPHDYSGGGADGE